MALDLTTFEFETREVRVVMRGDDPWFVAADVCAVLDIAYYRDALSKLDDDERGSVEVDTLGGRQAMAAVNESGLYTLILRSRPAMTPGTVHHRFRKWVTGEVLPSLRRTGRYETPRQSSLDSLPREDVSNWLSLIREARILRGREVAAAMWDQSPLPPLLNEENPSPDQQLGSVEEFLAECVVVTGHQHEFVRAATLIDAFWRWQDARDEARMGLRTVSNAFSRLAGVWRCPNTGKRFSKAKRSTSGYRGIRLVGPQDTRPRR